MPSEDEQAEAISLSRISDHLQRRVLFLCRDLSLLEISRLPGMPDVQQLYAAIASDPDFKREFVKANNAGLGTFYRSQHELIFVYKVGTAAHINNFGLGDGGRHRTNVWDYAGLSGASANRMADLQMHPTVKPVALVKDAILDCSRRGGIVLDMFGRSGTTLIAAEKSGRVARLIEYDPIYCDTVIRRYEALTGKPATHVETKHDFERVAQCRSASLEAGVA